MYISGRLVLHQQNSACFSVRTRPRLHIEMSYFKANRSSLDLHFDAIFFYPAKPTSLKCLLHQVRTEGHKAGGCLLMKLWIAHMGRVWDVD